LEAVAVTFLTHNTTITQCNIYIPNQTNLLLKDIENIIKQLPSPFIITGDFNCHSELWGSDKTDERGKIIEKVLDNDNIIILNNGDPTRFNSGNGNFSAIDLTFSNSSISHQLGWQVIPQIYSSDHIPILITIYKKNYKNKNSSLKRRNLKNPNWTLFSSIIEEDVKQLNSNNTDILSMVSLLTETIISAAKKSIGECTVSLLNHRVPWWNKEIGDIIILKKKHLKNFKLQKTLLISSILKNAELKLDS